MPSKRVIAFCAMAIMASRAAVTEADESSNNNSSSSQGFVNCGHVQRLFDLDSSLFKLGKVLERCWQHGITQAELEAGLKEVASREDVQNYGFQDLYLPCQEVFSSSFRKLTSRLLKDYTDCKALGTLNFRTQSSMDWRFVDIFEVYTSGNKSANIDERTMVSCGNATKALTLLCRQYGLTDEQWRRGFFRYYYNDKWVVEEDVAELSLTCDQVFNARLYNEVYDNPVEQFVRCQKTLPILPEKRDLFEKKYAEELIEYRAQESDLLTEFDLRRYVSCRHLLVENVASASKQAMYKCRSTGLTYEEVRAGRDPPDEDDSTIAENDLNLMYLGCEDVFNDNLDKFTSGLLGDYEACKDAGAISQKNIRAVQKRFSKLFKLFADQRLVKKKNVTDELVSCLNFTGKLAELCRNEGFTMAQELRGLDSLARQLGDLWLNVEPLDRLFLRCDQLFKNHMRYLKQVPVDRFMHCRWTDLLDDGQKAYIDQRISKFFNNKHLVNETRYIGDTDVKISSTILFD